MSEVGAATAGTLKLVDEITALLAKVPNLATGLTPDGAGDPVINIYEWVEATAVPGLRETRSAVDGATQQVIDEILGLIEDLLKYLEVSPLKVAIIESLTCNKPEDSDYDDLRIAIRVDGTELLRVPDLDLGPAAALLPVGEGIPIYKDQTLPLPLVLPYLHSVEVDISDYDAIGPNDELGTFRLSTSNSNDEVNEDPDLWLHDLLGSDARYTIKWKSVDLIDIKNGAGSALRSLIPSDVLARRWTERSDASGTALAYCNGNIFMAGTPNNRLYMKPADSLSAAWTDIGGADNVRCMGASDSELFCISDAKIWRRPADGTQVGWTEVTAGDGRAIACLEDRLFVIGGGDVLYSRSTAAGGEAWVKHGSLQLPRIRSLSQSSTRLVGLTEEGRVLQCRPPSGDASFGGSAAPPAWGADDCLADAKDFLAIALLPTSLVGIDRDHKLVQFSVQAQP